MYTKLGILVTLYSLFVLFFAGILLADNPIISQRYTADPNVFIFNDRLYVICSSDEDNGEGYNLLNYTLISSDDMVNWTDHNLVFKVKSVTTWAGQAYAPTALTRGGKVYLCFPNGASSLGMCVADRPEGPYKDLIGKAIVDRSTPNCAETGMEWLFDPCLFVDSTASGSQAYLVFGGGKPYGTNLRIVKVTADMKSISGTPQTINAPNSFEGPFLHKYNNRYYLSYPTSNGSDIDYLMSDDPMTGWVHKGTALPNPTLNGQNINLNNNSHESMIEYKGKWYMFYHDRRISNATYKRNVCVDDLKYDTDGKIQKVIVTSEGPAQIKNVNPYDTIQAETIWKQKGIETEFCNEGGVMVTAIAEGDYTSLKGVDFRDGAKSFQVRSASATSGGKVEVHLDSPTGTLVATCTITGTGGWTTWKTESCEVTNCSGVKNVYFVFNGTGEPFRLNWYRFVSVTTEINKNVFQIQKTNENRNLMCSSVCSRSLPKGITFDLSGRVTNIKAQNIQQHNLSADGLIIVKVK
jgi:arabinoxylan arabinofuranohydrolase